MCRIEIFKTNMYGCPNTKKQNMTHTVLGFSSPVGLPKVVVSLRASFENRLYREHGFKSLSKTLLVYFGADFGSC